MIRSSDKKHFGSEEKVTGISIECIVKFAKKVLGHKNNTSLICVTRGMIRADLIFKQQFDSIFYRLGL